MYTYIQHRLWFLDTYLRKTTLWAKPGLGVLGLTRSLGQRIYVTLIRFIFSAWLLLHLLTIHGLCKLRMSSKRGKNPSEWMFVTSAVRYIFYSPFKFNSTNISGLKVMCLQAKLKTCAAFGSPSRPVQGASVWAQQLLTDHAWPTKSHGRYICICYVILNCSVELYVNPVRTWTLDSKCKLTQYDMEGAIFRRNNTLKKNCNSWAFFTLFSVHWWNKTV